MYEYFILQKIRWYVYRLISLSRYQIFLARKQIREMVEKGENNLKKSYL